MQWMRSVKPEHENTGEMITPQRDYRVMNVAYVIFHCIWCSKKEFTRGDKQVTRTLKGGVISCTAISSSPPAVRLKQKRSQFLKHEQKKGFLQKRGASIGVIGEFCMFDDRCGIKSGGGNGRSTFFHQLKEGAYGCRKVLWGPRLFRIGWSFPAGSRVTAPGDQQAAALQKVHSSIRAWIQTNVLFIDGSLPWPCAWYCSMVSSLWIPVNENVHTQCAQLGAIPGASLKYLSRLLRNRYDFIC